MKKVICLILVIVTIFAGCFLYMNREVDIDVVQSVGTSFTTSILSDIQNLNENSNTEMDGYSVSNEMIDYLKNSDDFFINLSEYFDWLDFENDPNVTISDEETGLTSEELEELYERLGLLEETFVEEETIYVNENSDKCIKVNDLRRISTGEALVNYYDGEYVIAYADIPATYTFLENEGYFDFNLVSINKIEKNVYEFKYENNLNDFSSKIIFTLYFDDSEIENFEMIVKGFNPFK